MPGASWGPWGALIGVNGVSADPLQNPDAEFFVSWNVAPTPPTPGTKKCMPGASWGPWEALTGVNGVSADPLQNPDAEFFVSWNVAPTPPTPGTQQSCKPGAS